MNIHELADRITALEDAQFKQIGALQALGADCCDCCGEWKLNNVLIKAGDRCECRDCFQPERFVSTDPKDGPRILAELMPQVCNGRLLWERLPRGEDRRVLSEPFLTAYRRYCRSVA
jgi:uncharacterized protein (DUF983 family)